MLCIYSKVYNWQIPFASPNPATVPDSWNLFKQVMVCIMCEDLVFYTTHRILHCKDKRLPLYQWIHKIHHEHIHPVSIAAEYAHPIEYGLANHFPSFVGLFVLGSKTHLWTVVIWGLIRIFETHDGHSGYEFPWSIFRLIPFGEDSTYHIFHHTKNVGNYASFMTIWDTVFDTNKDYYEAYPEKARLDSDL